MHIKEINKVRFQKNRGKNIWDSKIRQGVGVVNIIFDIFKMATLKEALKNKKGTDVYL